MTNIKEFSAFLASRRTTRDFLPTPIEASVISELITDGLTAPSWSNTRPYMVAIATGEVRDRISADMMRRAVLLTGFRVGNLADKIKFLFTPKAWPISDHSMLAPYPVELQPRARKVGKELYGLIGVPRGDKQAREKQWMKNYEFFGAPVELFIFAHKDLGVHAANDAGLFSQNLMLSAHARGLGTCAQGAAVLWADAIRREFNVPKGYKLLYGIAIGHPADSVINTFGADRISAAAITVPLARG